MVVFERPQTLGNTGFVGLENMEKSSCFCASNSKTLAVEFSRNLTAEEKAAAIFVVNYTNNPITVKPVAWVGNNIATFERADSGKLNVGAYSVVVTGVTTVALTMSGTVAAEVATSLAINTERVKKAAAEAISYDVLNQYEEVMTGASITAAAYNLTDPTRTVTGTLASMNFSGANVGDIVRVTAYVTSNPTINAIKNITVSNIFISALTLADPVLPTGVTTMVAGTAGVTIEPTVVDNYSLPAKLTVDAGITSGDVNDGFVVTFTNISNVSILANGKIQFTLGTAGAASITFTNLSTGVSVSKAFTVLAVADTARIEMDAPTTPVRIGVAKNIVYRAYDQYGVLLTSADTWFATTDVQLSSSNPAVATATWVAGNNLHVTGHSTGTAVIYANVLTTVANPATAVTTLTVTVQAAPTVTSVSVNGTPTTSLANNQTVGSATTGALKFNITDQDGVPVDLAAATVVGVKLNLAVANSVPNVITAPANNTVLNTMSATTGLTNGITVTAGAVGTATITAILFNDANGNDVMDAGEALASAAIITYTVSTPVLTKGVISSIVDTGTSTVVANANNSVAYSDYDAVDGVVEFTYDLLDQASNALTTTTPTNVVWTITNYGATAITVNDGTAKTLAAGATASYTTVAAAGAGADATILVTGAAEGKVLVSAAAAGVATPSVATLYYTEQMVGAGQTFNGTVVGLCKTDNWLILQTSVGYVVVDDYVAAGTFTLVAYTVDGSTATLVQFEAALTVNDGVVITTDATPDATIALTNN